MYLKNIKAWTIIMSLVWPMSVFAGKVTGTFGADELLADSVVIAIVALFSLMGGVAATFIKTDADEFVSSHRVAKVFIGFWVGIASGLGIYTKYKLSVYMLLFPVLATASLGSVIMVFYMQYLSDPATRKALREKIDEKLQIKRGGGA